MKTDFSKKIAAVLERHQTVAHAMAETRQPDELATLGRELSDLEAVAPMGRRWLDLEQEKRDLEALAEDDDPEVKSLARQDLPRVNEELLACHDDLKRALLPRDQDDGRDVIIEIRPGTGGDEAALFGDRLFTMYRSFAGLNGLGVEVIDLNQTELGGVQHVVFAIRGGNAYRLLKYESGVHRVQRVPKTESSGRIHTSAATVAVLPEAEEVDVSLEDKDLRVDTFRAQGAGGQHVNTTDSAVRITHLPTGTVVSCQDGKSQHKNRAKAMKVLRSRIYDQERQNRDAERASLRKGQIGAGDRSERIRTYNFPQSRVTDHRIGLTLHKLEQVLSGEGLGEMVEALRLEDEASQLAALEDGA